MAVRQLATCIAIATALIRVPSSCHAQPSSPPASALVAALKPESAAALQALQDGASAGSVPAMLTLGLVYQTIKPTDLPLPLVFIVYDIREEQPKLADFALQLAVDPAFKPDNEIALRWLRAAATADSHAAKVEIAWMKLEGKGTPKDRVSAFADFEAMAKAGNKNAMFALGTVYMGGHGFDRDDVKSTEWFRKAAEAGQVQGMCDYSVSLRHGIGGVAKDADAAVALLNKASDRGWPNANVQLGRIMIEGALVPKDVKGGLALVEQGIQQGSRQGYRAMGFLHEHGRGVAKDEKAAADWYRRGAEKGIPYCQTALGRLYLDGRGVARDEKRGVELLTLAAENGDEFAMYDLSHMYADGEHVPKDRRAALKWLQKSAEAGNKDAVKELSKREPGF